MCDRIADRSQFHRNLGDAWMSAQSRNAEQKLNREWFEMRDIRRRRLNSAVWIPLRAVCQIEKVGRHGFRYFREEFFGAGSLAVPIEARDVASKLGWSNVGIMHSHRPYVDQGLYHPSDAYELGEDFDGIHLALEQRTNRNELDEWHLHQDFVLALGLKREHDVWLATNEDYVEVARLKRKEDVLPCLLEVRAEHLRDYLSRKTWSYTSRPIEIGWLSSTMPAKSAGPPIRR